MPRRKRRFESLEDRRLLAAWASPSTPVGSAADVAPVSAGDANPAASTAAPSASGANGNTDGGSAAQTSSYDNYSEYAPAASSQADSSSNGYSYASPSSSYNVASSNDSTSASEYAASNEYTNNYNDSSKTSPTAHATNVSTPLTLTAPASTSGAADVQINSSSAGPFALLAPPAGQGPSAATSPPAARTASAALVAIEGESAVVSGEPVASPSSLSESELAPPIALASYEKALKPVEVSQPTGEEFVAQSERARPSVEFGSRGPIAELSGINLAAIERGIDEVFDRIERLGDDWAGEVGATRFAEWLVIAGGACAAFEYVRARFREVGPWQAVGGWPILREPRLRRRWFPPRSGR